MAAIRLPDPKMARGRVRRGSLISSLIMDAISRPVKANASCGQKLTVSQSQCGTRLAHVNCVTDPCRSQMKKATPNNISKGR